MPKIVDHAQQKIKVAEAAWRVIRRSGIENASVRNVAQEAGISPGSMRHYFSTQAELFSFSMNLVSERVNQRILKLSFERPVPEVARDLLREMVPLNEESRSEMEVWLAFTSKSMSEPSLRDHADRVYEEMRQAMARILQAMVEYEFASDNLNVEEEAVRMQTYVDGIALHGLLYPDRMPPSRMEKMLDDYLASLCKKEN
ncbi:TetR/AcrR family transcriptional regulator [Saccharibacillus alkalitolerans]|uniref:TetR family transcriptional regulator n=1 Tax=Saccharibacillus alkalitolerans TaxID=2705290 RepID=A0ABX0FB24_9BACL|nr:TetR family transcriptional regulator C-terminal domain-containing protein [Saccharibacillus alkalitolerans]NGZ78158.1 TetR family transcriptional regulator [Saccharibacillus alkalitolerans]